MFKVNNISIVAIYLIMENFHECQFHFTIQLDLFPLKHMCVFREIVE